MSTQVSALSRLSGRCVPTDKNGINVLNVRRNNFTEAVSNPAKTFMSLFSVLLVTDSCLYLVSVGYFRSEI
jgi:hypothetical protein